MNSMYLEITTEDVTLRQLCEHYWAQDSEGNFTFKTSEITKKYGVSSTRLRQLVVENCNAYSLLTICVECGTSYIFTSRSDYQQSGSSSRKNWLCQDCTNKKKQEEAIRKRELEIERQAIIKREFDLSNRKNVNLADISFEDAATLLSVIRFGATEDFSFIAPIGTFNNLFAPTEALQFDILKQLFRNKLLYVHPDSPPAAFEFEGNATKLFYLSAVIWAFPLLSETETPKKVAEKLEQVFLDMEWPDHWFEERLAFCKKVALHECLQYLDISLEDHKFKFKPGEKTYLVLNNLLEDFSVGQIYSFIWRAAKDAAAFYVKEQVPKQHAANTVVGSIQRQAERARSEGWDVKSYRRDRRCPQSMVSQVLYNTALHIGDEGFSKPLNASL